MPADVNVSASARITAAGGRIAALVDEVPVGGGTQVVTVDGSQEERTHPLSNVFHVRLISPDRSISDELREVATYDEAVAIGIRHAEKLNAHAASLDAFAADTI